MWLVATQAMAQVTLDYLRLKMEIIIRKSKPTGRTRSSINERMQGEWGTTTLTPEQNDKCKYLESVVKEKYGADKSMFKQSHINEIKLKSF